MLMSLAQPEQARVTTAGLASAAETIEVAEAVGRSARNSAAWSGLATRPGWPLTLLLVAQSLLSARLVGSNTAFSDEALYLWAGRLELAHLLHGSAVPNFATYFSGSPVLYPPLGAIAAATGGLPVARLLSLVMMLAATAMLHGITRRLFDRRAAFFAAALFAGLAGTQFLGALATYDAMALSLMGLAAWLAVLSADRAGRRAVVLTATAAGALALANATKYASTLFDPVVLCVAVLTVCRGRGRAAAVRTGAVLLATLGGLLAIALLAGGEVYLRGLSSTTLDRRTGSYPATYLLMLSAKWLWAVALLAAVGIVAAVTARRGASFALLISVLAVAVLLAPAEQARIHTLTSLFKHDDYGAWFGCAAAGYAVAAISRVVPPVKAVAAFRAGVVAVALAALPGIPAASHQYGWPNTTALTAYMQRVLAAHPGPVLSDDGGVLLHYYLPREVSGRQVVGTAYIRYRGPGDAHAEAGLAGYADAIDHRYFAVILLEFVDNLAVDYKIERDVTESGDYQYVHSIPYREAAGLRDFMVWIRRGST